MDLRIVVLVGWCLFVGRVWSQKAVNGTVTIPNNDVCANTLIGTDYTGKLTVTGSGARCRHWSPIANQIPVQNADSTFPDRTVLEASNYCRNPYQFGTFNSPGFPTYRQQPFCYVGTTGNAEELCEIPLCGVPDEREVCNHRLRSPPSGVTLKTCSCSVNAIASNINKHFLTVDYLYKVLPSANCDLKAGLDILRVNKDQSANCENGEVFNVTENAAVYVQNVKAYFSGQLTNALYEYKISYAGYKSVSIKQCDNPEWSFSALWQTVVSEQRNDFWKIHIEFVEPTPTVDPSTPASTGTDSVSSTGTGTVVSSTNIVSSTSVSIPSSVQSSTGGTDSSSVTTASTDSSTPVQSSTGTVASTLVSSQSASSSDNTIQPSSSPGDQSSSVQPSSSAGSQTVQPSSSGVTGTVQPSSSGATGTAQPSSSSVTGSAHPSSSGTPPLSTTGGTAQSTTGTVASSITSPQSSATSVQTSGTGSVDSSTSGGGTDHSSGAQSSNSVRTTGTESQNTGTGINPTATQTSSTGTGISATTEVTATGTPSSSTPGVTTAPKMEINDQEWKLAVGLGVAMCILFILGVLLACFIVHVCCCKERAKRRRELYYAAQLQAEKDSPQGNGVLPTITVTSVPDGKPLEIITSNEDGQSLSSANPNDVEIEIPKDDIDEPGYATIRKPDTDTPSLTSDVDPAYATVQRGDPPPVPPKIDGKDETVTAAVVTNGVGSKTASRRGSESDSIKLAAHESSHHPDVLLANKHVTIGDEKHVRIAANGRVKEIPRPLVVPPSDSERKKGGKPRAYSSLPRVRHAENPTVHSYSPSYTVVTPHRQRQFATNNSLRYVSSPPRSPVFLVRGQGGPVVAGGQNIPMRGLVLRPPAPARIPGRYRKRGHPGHSSMRSSRSAEFGDL